MGVQAGASRVVLDHDPAAARAALASVEDTARTTLEELHRLLTTLREVEPEGQVGADERDLVGVAQLPGLVEQSRASGVPTSLSVLGEPRPLPGLHSLNLYRIAQEALTNVRRHGGPTASADVRLRYLDDAVELEVANTGASPTSSGVSRGLGQRGIRERVAACGGTVETGPRSRGGYLVRAHLPTAVAPPAAAGQTTGTGSQPDLTSVAGSHG
jgi:signal transduction histidine kinase